MRLISQDGRYDFPYEKVMVTIEPEKMCDILVSTPETAVMGQAIIAAEYSTPEKAIKAMEQLQYAYRHHLKAPARSVMGGSFYVPEFRFNPPKAFKFPSDSEV